MYLVCVLKCLLIGHLKYVFERFLTGVLVTVLFNKPMDAQQCCRTLDRPILLMI